MTYDDSSKLPLDRKILARLFSNLTISTKHFYKGEPCWEWMLYRERTGYSRTTYVNPLTREHLRIGTHCLMYRLFVGEIPLSHEVDHLCRIRHCCNPAHLEAVTSRVNVLRGISFSAVNAKKTHCLNGHLLDGENLIVDKQRTKAGKATGSPMRICRECRRHRGKRDAQRWRDARKAEGLSTHPYSEKLRKPPV